ncbi:MAG: thiamine pyrophosphate-dependent dehydrogenase E1 component subunit alpha [Alicyclobacillus macrosporangiidus]|uniref:thiamine pyrophosphate-dependent dehydrogenase E1 component subunit alpha n=1 Tax=Alicyclobacillus macrosporangiidus TaxID=392015 RepID=UPI0026EF0514|nr:thiamine pyrophosphate-dependent dehydrogenase E1 component subunit alpha [Alicyclobacillus macrosporangiidus]MCL6597609.1 thiamine pyrophosphate-dependent dehydrogenase E1 component subunit alpha [Alicyclobacillus macrosporangiidus]
MVVPTWTEEEVRAMYRTMVRIRAFEEKVADLFRTGVLYGHVHTYVGQEAVAAGVLGMLSACDRVTSTHRGHGHLIAIGGDMRYMMAELFGREKGYCRGKGGSMHIADVSLGMLGANAIVGAGVPIAVGSALSQALQSDGGLTVSFFGDGGANQGAVYEALNLAAIWKLPVIFVCENNRYAITTAAESVLSGSIVSRALGFGVPSLSVDGQDVLAVRDAAREAVTRARQGEGPTVIECRTYRFRGHTEGEEGLGWHYRSEEEVMEYKKRDPIQWLEQRLPEFLPEDFRAVTWRNAVAEVEDAVAFAQDCPEPPPTTLFEDILASQEGDEPR